MFMGTELLLGVWQTRLIILEIGSMQPQPPFRRAGGGDLGGLGAKQGFTSPYNSCYGLTDEDKDNVQSYEY